MGNLPQYRRTKVEGCISQADVTPWTNPTAVLFSRLQKGSMGRLFAIGAGWQSCPRTGGPFYLWPSASLKMEIGRETLV